MQGGWRFAYIMNFLGLSTNLTNITKNIMEMSMNHVLPS